MGADRLAGRLSRADGLSFHHRPVDPLEVFERRELHHHPATAVAELDLHTGVEVRGEQVLELQDPRLRQPSRAGRAGRTAGTSGRTTGRTDAAGLLTWDNACVVLPASNCILNLADREPFGDDAPDESLLERPVRRPQEGAGVAGG